MNTELLRRAIEEALNRPGMTAGLPKVTVDAARLAHLLDHYEWLRDEEKRLTVEVGRLRSKLETISELLVDIRFHAVTAAQLAAVKQIREE